MNARWNGLLLAGLSLVAAGAWACSEVLSGDDSPKHAERDKAIAAAQAGKALTPFWVGPSVSGSWFNPARAGEGWTLEYLDDGTVSVVWYTFPTGTGNAGQAWILGQGGVVDGNKIRFTTVYTARGGRFGPDFDPDDVVLEPWGTLEFTFTACDAGTMTYAGPAAFGTGSQPIARLVSVRELSCAGERMRTASGNRAGAALRAFSGSWLDPSHGGEGWVVEALTPTVAGVYWFTYTTTGEQAWFLGLGTLDGDRLVVTEMQRPQGTGFGDNFDPDDVRRESWGTLTFQFTGCNSGTVTYASTQNGFGNGTLNAVRLTTLASATCLDTLAAARTQGTWSEERTMPDKVSEATAAAIGQYIYVAGGYPGQRHFQRYDTTNGQWTRLAPLPGGRDHAEALAYDGKVWVFGGFLAGDDQSPAWTYDPASNTWTAVQGVPLVATSSAVLLNGYFYLGNGDGFIHQYNPRTGAKRAIAPLDAFDRDHSSMVAYLGELWILGGRDGIVREQQGVTIFDPVTETWRRGPRLRSVHAGAAASVVDNQIMIAGGEVIYSAPTVFKFFEIMAPGAEGWVRGPDMLTAIHGLPGVTVNGRFYTMGGSTLAAGATNPGTMQVYHPQP